MLFTYGGSRGTLDRVDTSRKRKGEAEGLEQDVLEVLCHRGPHVVLDDMFPDWKCPGTTELKRWGRCGCRHINTSDVCVHGTYGCWIAVVPECVAWLAFGTMTKYTPLRWFSCPSTHRHIYDDAVGSGKERMYDDCDSCVVVFMRKTGQCLMQTRVACLHSRRY